MKDYCKTPAVYKEVVIIGNGPSGLVTSYLLSGRCPTYNGQPLDDPLLTARLSDASGRSLYETELNVVAEGLEGDGASPVGLLTDKLLRNEDGTSCLNWRCCKKVDHIVIGNGPPGGAWHSINGDTLTLSLSSWMELPGYKFSDFISMPRPDDRVKASELACYYVEYARRMGLLKYQRRGLVTCLRSMDEVIEDSDRKVNWEIEGRDSLGRKFLYHSRFVVLAVGTNNPNMLGIPGEDNKWVTHDTKLYFEENDNLPILVVGGGLSASDAVISSLRSGKQVIHIFRKHKRRIPPSVYPEYDQVERLMLDKTTSPNYQPRQGAELIKLYTDGHRNAVIRSNGTIETICVQSVAILIGSNSDLSFTDLKITPGVRVPNAYTVGPLAGDKFVRYVLGSALLAVSDIHKNMTNG